ncbi:hypothetical protein AVE30378_02566 [Achromobacter veterisilvae]|uniref:IraD/Gp25-like domain-containing protein n=1 Tax=Achromobacter veterisilvae TaxID=2069367 RepID=A0A446CHP7_9BURK|nr:hypothetical protein [Achromobacter veterisilvae]SSW67331.1 hypothetical protein AVE30378_02566 [Achromobacter veterisilvae]
MSLDIALSDDGDLALDLMGATRLIVGADRVRQQIKISLQAFLGEWFLDTSFGVPYFESILVKNPDRASIEAVLRARIVDVPSVTAVRRLGLEIDRTARELRVTFVADTTEGLVDDIVTL